MTSHISKEELLSLKTLEKSFKKVLKDKGNEKDDKIIDQYLTDKFSEAIIKITPYLKKYKNVKNLEMEVRLGYIEDNNSFTTNIGDDFFEKIKNSLEKTPIWDNTTSSSTNDYFSKGMRMSVQSDENEAAVQSGNQTVIIKKKLCTLDFAFNGTPFDIRISFSTENSVPIEDFNKDDVNYQRFKKRDSYIYDCWNYDITTVTYEENDVEEMSYEVEIEVNRSINAVLKQMSPYYFLHSTFLKIEDIANMCEKQDEDNMTRLEFINEKTY